MAKENGNGTTARDAWALIIALVAIASLGVGLVVLARYLAVDPLQWARLQYLFGAVEALAFAAAGWLWGKEVHRQQAVSAERRADEASENEKAATQRAAAADVRNKVIAEEVRRRAESLRKAFDDVGGARRAVRDAHVAPQPEVQDHIDALNALASALLN